MGAFLCLQSVLWDPLTSLPTGCTERLWSKQEKKESVFMGRASYGQKPGYTREPCRKPDDQCTSSPCKSRIFLCSQYRELLLLIYLFVIYPTVHSVLYKAQTKAKNPISLQECSNPFCGFLLIKEAMFQVAASLPEKQFSGEWMWMQNAYSFNCCLNVNVDKRATQRWQELCEADKNWNGTIRSAGGIWRLQQFLY